MLDIIEISKKVLARLSAMDYERTEDKGVVLSEQLIFPKIRSKEDIKRISEQEFRLLFIEEFKKEYPKLFYSIETPTEERYKFGKVYKDIKKDEEGQSALIDMCIFNNYSGKYERRLNIEFKHNNASINNITKDILKLMSEEQNGAFIILLNNTDSGTLCNTNKDRKGVFDKLYISFNDFKANWNNDKKSIQLIILSLEQRKNKLSKPVLIHRKITKTDLGKMKEIFFIDDGCGNITEIKGKEWKVEFNVSSNE